MLKMLKMLKNEEMFLKNDEGPEESNCAAARSVFVQRFLLMGHNEA